MMLLVGSVIVMLLTIYVAFFKKDAIRLETMKVGGQENFTQVQQLYSSDSYKSQQATMIQQVLSSMKAPEATDTTTTETPSTTIDKAKIDTIKKDGYIEGKE